MRSMLCTRARSTDDGRSGQRCRYNWLRDQRSGNRKAVGARFSETVQVIGISFQEVKWPRCGWVPIPEGQPVCLACNDIPTGSLVVPVINFIPCRAFSILLSL